MSIISLDNIIASAKQKVTLFKAARTTLANVYFSMFDITGNPGAGTMAIGNTANGTKPDDTVAGYPIINAFGGGAVGYMGGVEANNNAASRIQLYDRLFAAGAYAFTGATTTLASQPAISSRCPDYPGSGIVFGNGNQIWIEVSTAFVTGTNWQVQVTYTNSVGTTGRTSIISIARAAAALILGTCFQLALQSGDNGVQKIESVIVTNGATLMTAGAFNVMILRPLWGGRINTVNAANGAVKDDFAKVGLPVLYADSALYILVIADGASSGVPELIIDVWNN